MRAIERHVRNPSSLMNRFIVITGASKGSVAPLPVPLQTTALPRTPLRQAQPKQSYFAPIIRRAVKARPAIWGECQCGDSLHRG
jgi:hypothetical protein